MSEGKLICSRLISWRWWVVLIFIVPPALILWLPTKIPAVILSFLAEKVDHLDYLWVGLLNEIFIPPFGWAKKHYDNYE